MSVLVVGEHPWFATWLGRRRALGLDGRDEVWAGTQHVAPLTSVEHGRVAAQVLWAVGSYADAAGLVSVCSFNLGDPQDYRVPDGGWLRGEPTGMFAPTAAVVLEVLSPDDETFAKFGFYHSHGVPEVLVADPDARTVTCQARRAAGYTVTPRSDRLHVAMADLADAIRWP